MNEEIVRVLEREFPPAAGYADRVDELMKLLAVLRAETTDDKITDLNEKLRETLDDMFEGKLVGMSDEAREAILKRYSKLKYHEMVANYERFFDSLDDEEKAQFMATGDTAKYE